MTTQKRFATQDAAEAEADALHGDDPDGSFEVAFVNEPGGEGYWIVLPSSQVHADAVEVMR